MASLCSLAVPAMRDSTSVEYVTRRIWLTWQTQPFDRLVLGGNNGLDGWPEISPKWLRATCDRKAPDWLVLIIVWETKRQLDSATFPPVTDGLVSPYQVSTLARDDRHRDCIRVEHVPTFLPPSLLNAQPESPPSPSRASGGARRMLQRLQEAAKRSV